MTVQQCDICDKEISSANLVIVGKLWAGAEICGQCAQPVIVFLAKHNLLERARLSHLQNNTEQVL